MPTNLPHLHSVFLEHLLKKVEGEPLVEAILAAGSLLHGGLDRFSDLDLTVVVAEGSYERAMSSRLAFASRLGTLLASFTGEHVGEPRLLICLYGPELLHVDLKFVELASLDHLIERPQVLFARDEKRISAVLNRAIVEWPNHPAQWFEDRAWIWLHYATTKLQRGEIFEGMGMIAFFRDQILGPLLHRRSNRPQRGVRRIESDEVATKLLLPVVATHSRSSLKAAISSAAALYMELRRDDPPALPTALMPDSLLAMLEE